ncbi:rab9 effector protein [Anaeramoeba ignava]|uniref:Rab9 effector protein n=1 Tax=Anaeramoeba ignava TaxID=1746090 RepID=A0A9Q0LSX9_ANAIG|nr:rab9 effector protein [Anaeramoeba ignava]
MSLLWTEIKGSRAPRERRGASIVLFEDELYLFGGLGNIYFNDLYKYNFNTTTWTKISYTGKISLNLI